MTLNHYICNRMSALVLLCGVFVLPSCERASDGAPPRQFHSWTTDVILTDSARYLVDRSPLKGIKGYEKFFFLGEEILMYNGIPGDDDGRADMFPSHGECEKEYTAVWKLADSMLFLTGLDPLSNRVGIKGNTQHIRPMKEILIGRSLIDEETPLDGTPIPCTWVTGTYYVKKGSEHYGNIYADYQTRPFLRNDFRKRQIIVGPSDRNATSDAGRQHRIRKRTETFLQKMGSLLQDQTPKGRRTEKESARGEP